ncbi:TIGR03086 family protein [Prauserella sp. ASG 168]|uniref:TIGR03086 family protein n=2 Tax=Prauserella cavernicola TaxID=2800127 RepID=A0A934QTS2_9PSEU|nr:TIGR03086 family protein [Prauserella cavernicola]
MSDLREPIKIAAADLIRVVHGVRAGHLAEPTPCESYDVRGLCNHLLYWGPALHAAARKSEVPPRAAAEESADLVTGDWAARLVRQTEDLACALADPDAWQGGTTMGGGDLPASMVGEMVLCEFVLHGWDLARATGQQLVSTDETGEAAEMVMLGMAEQGRRLQVFGEAVPVADSASAFERALGLSGRSPDWSR